MGMVEGEVEVCGFCGEPSPSKLVIHHWPVKGGSFGAARVCRVCNHLLTEERMVREFGGFPPLEVQRAYAKAYKRKRRGEDFELSFKEEMEREGLEVLEEEEKDTGGEEDGI